MNRLDDRGSASVATAGLVAALLCLVLIVVNVAAAVVHSHQARNAADTAAIAGALTNEVDEVKAKRLMQRFSALSTEVHMGGVNCRH